jgi:dihydrofolate reductase
VRKLVVFNSVTLDGYFAGKDGDISWAKTHTDPEFNAFVEENAKSEGQLLFGRITYEMMTSYWPTPRAMQNDPVVAERMNHLTKIVFSRTLQHASWNNTKVMKGDLAEAIRQMKKEPGNDMVILGSGSIVSQLSQQRLIDEYQIVLNPVVIGAGRTMFDGVQQKLPLKLTRTRTFSRSGNVLLAYEPVS